MIWSCGYNEDTLRIFMGCSWVLVITSKTWWCTEESSVIPTTPAGILSPHERGWNAKYEGTPTQNCHEMMVYIPYIAGWNIHIYWYIIHIYIYIYIYIHIYIYCLCDCISRGTHPQKLLLETAVTPSPCWPCKVVQKPCERVIIKQITENNHRTLVIHCLQRLCAIRLNTQFTKHPVSPKHRLMVNNHVMCKNI